MTRPRASLAVDIVCPGLPFDPADPLGRSLGGTETAAVQLARTLARQNHAVRLFATVDRSHRWQGVALIPEAAFPPEGEPSDLTLIIDNELPLALLSSSKLTFLWTHNIHGLDTPFVESVLRRRALDRFVCVSKFQRDLLQKQYPAVPPEHFLPTRNGLDLELIAQGRALAGPRRRNRIVLTSRPERGSDVLAKLIFPMILGSGTDATLTLAYYSNLATPGDVLLNDCMHDLAARSGGRVTLTGALDKVQLYQLLHESGLWLYPGPSPLMPSFVETSCIALMEAMACGVPALCSARGALPETGGDAAAYVELDGPTAADGTAPMWFALAARKLLLDRGAWEEHRRRGLAHAAGLGWEPVAERIVAEAVAILEERAPGAV